jgi:tetratricopeptide (TPR) repeat protein
MKKYWILIGFITLTEALLCQNSALLNAFRSSYTFEEKGDWTQAANALKKVYDENSYETNLRLGWLLYNGGQHTESTSYYQRAIKNKPMSIEARLGYVLPASVLGHWNQILSVYREILNIDPNHTLTNYRVGSIYYGRKDYKTAERYFEKVVNMYPFDYDTLLMLGWTKYFLGKTGEAKVIFNKVLLYSPSDKSALEGLGLLK